MDTVSIAPPFDTLSFNLRAEDTIVSDTVKIIVRVNAYKNPGEPEDGWIVNRNAAVRAMIDATQHNTKWQFSNTTRTMEPSGLESITLTASVRVPESENYDLHTRAEAASKPGLRLTSVVADTSMPNEKLQATQSALRRTLLAQALVEAVDLQQVTGAPRFILHAIEFGGISLPSPSNTRAMAVAASKSAYGTGGSSDDDVISNAAKVTMDARVTLRASRA